MDGQPREMEAGGVALGLLLLPMMMMTASRSLQRHHGQPSGRLQLHGL